MQPKPKTPHPHAGPCALRILHEFYTSEEAREIALEFTCFPMDCALASFQALKFVLATKKPSDYGGSSDNLGDPAKLWLAEKLPEWRRVAREVGYALAVHGSEARDIDIAAIPWTDDAGSAQDLVDALTGTIGKLGTDYGFGYRVGDPDPMTTQPHGRMSWAITPLHLGTYIDLSVMPTREPGE